MTPGCILQGERKGAQHHHTPGAQAPSPALSQHLLSSLPTRKPGELEVVSVSLGRADSFLAFPLLSFSFPAWETSYFRSRAEETLAAEKPEETWLKAAAPPPTTASHQFIGVPGCGPALGSWHFRLRARLFGLETGFTLPQK